MFYVQTVLYLFAKLHKFYNPQLGDEQLTADEDHAFRALSTEFDPTPLAKSPVTDNCLLNIPHIFKQSEYFGNDVWKVNIYFLTMNMFVDFSP